MDEKTQNFGEIQRNWKRKEIIKIPHSQERIITIE